MSERNSHMDKEVPVEVFAGSIITAGMVKSYLENASIDAYLKDELMGTMNPWWVTAGGVGAVKVVVSSRDAEKALQLVKEFESRLA
ncbi:MAG: hypothetical protein RL732_937 [Bacteroidota bacterium]|jgi:hypothetical protein